jgi:hypothetical protein
MVSSLARTVKVQLVFTVFITGDDFDKNSRGWGCRRLMQPSREESVRLTRNAVTNLVRDASGLQSITSPAESDIPARKSGTTVLFLEGRRLPRPHNCFGHTTQPRPLRADDVSNRRVSLAKK